MCNFLFDTIQDKVLVQKETEHNELKRTRGLETQFKVCFVLKVCATLFSVRNVVVWFLGDTAG